ncbi:glucose-inhibited division protein A [Synechococcus sp. BS56D]|uniref:FAD-dependent oxidoreductase n=1 Tax=Synechococcus sp. BS56D TaxID=2055944 RepID=UPI00103EB052|nr:FAD-dependent oxidoreductase [Synechococcus sp. BS56D]TCD58454.1 glucose-inhibited division protein A [Synechococcus sp. BS56D]
MSASLDTFDVLVWGGGTGGAAAAIQSARGGASTLLLTPGSWLGGMVSAAGVCCPDGNELTPWQTGLWGAFLRELERREPDGLDHNWVSCFGYRPTTAEQILQDWVAAEPKLLWWPRCRLLEVERQHSLITAVRVDVDGEQRRVGCHVVIDGSDRGDLLPLAEAPFRLGWEAQEQWGEPSAPSRQRLATEPFFQEQPVQSPTWVVMGQLQNAHLQADPARGIDPDGCPKLPASFERACEAFGLERTLTYGRLPGGLVMLNWPLHGNDWHWGLDRAFGGDPQQEAELYAEMQGHSLRFAEALKEVSGGWLQLGHAFPADSGSPAPWLASMPYWREGRRMVGRSMVIEQDLLPLGEGASCAPLPRDAVGALQSIAVGNYANDHHYPGPDWPLAPKSCRWGGRWTGTPFCIPYGALVSAEIDNLLAADKAISTSHMANGATRLQPLVLNVGQAAGAAAALSVASLLPPVELSVRQLQTVLLDDPVAPSAVVPLWTTPWHHPQWRERQEQALAEDCDWSRGGQDHLDALPLSLPPSSPQECVWAGLFSRDGRGCMTLTTEDGHIWPLITLEPGMHHWLSSLQTPTALKLIGRPNPWGPWLRISGRVN